MVDSYVVSSHVPVKTVRKPDASRRLPSSRDCAPSSGWKVNGLVMTAEHTAVNARSVPMKMRRIIIPLAELWNRAPIP